MRIAVSTVMWSEPMIRAPFSGFFGPYLARVCMSPGISGSSVSMSFRPRSASLMSLTLYFMAVACSLSNPIPFANGAMESRHLGGG